MLGKIFYLFNINWIFSKSLYIFFFLQQQLYDTLTVIVSPFSLPVCLARQTNHLCTYLGVLHSVLGLPIGIWVTGDSVKAHWNFVCSLLPPLLWTPGEVLGATGGGPNRLTELWGMAPRPSIHPPFPISSSKRWDRSQMGSVPIAGSRVS